ncbi:MAG: collagen-like protein, partial [Clostridiaceae bacterium]|nr:collagen-like protein [Clostridiaceae bacterium]
PFDTVVEAYNDKITNDAGVISFITPGKYLVDWSVSLDGSSDATSISFQLKNPEKTTEVLPKSESPVVIPNTFSGTALIQIFDATETTPFKLQLNNSSKNLANADSELTLSDIGIQATIRIVEL